MRKFLFQLQLIKAFLIITKSILIRNLKLKQKFFIRCNEENNNKLKERIKANSQLPGRILYKDFNKNIREFKNQIEENKIRKRIIMNKQVELNDINSIKNSLTLPDLHKMLSLLKAKRSERSKDQTRFKSQLQSPEMIDYVKINQMLRNEKLNQLYLPQTRSRQISNNKTPILPSKNIGEKSPQEKGRYIKDDILQKLKIHEQDNNQNRDSKVSKKKKYISLKLLKEKPNIPNIEPPFDSYQKLQIKLNSLYTDEKVGNRLYIKPPDILGQQDKIKRSLSNETKLIKLPIENINKNREAKLEEIENSKIDIEIIQKINPFIKGKQIFSNRLKNSSSEISCNPIVKNKNI